MSDIDLEDNELGDEESSPPPPRGRKRIVFEDDVELPGGVRPTVRPVPPREASPAARSYISVSSSSSFPTPSPDRWFPPIPPPRPPPLSLTQAGSARPSGAVSASASAPAATPALTQSAARRGRKRAASGTVRARAAKVLARSSTTRSIAAFVSASASASASASGSAATVAATATAATVAAAGAASSAPAASPPSPASPVAFLSPSPSCSPDPPRPSSPQQRTPVWQKAPPRPGTPVGPHDLPAASDSATDTLGDLCEGGDLRNSEEAAMALNPSLAQIMAGLRSRSHVFLVDLDNWGGFFRRLRTTLPPSAFVLGFYRARGGWSPPWGCVPFERLIATRAVCVMPCSGRMDAADFALCFHAGLLHAQLSPACTFVVLSGDGGFYELDRQLQLLGRKAVLINPHQDDADLLWARLQSVWHQ